MENLNIDISTKNIGFASWETFEKRMIESNEVLVSHMRWKLFHFKKNKRKKQSNNFSNQNEEDADIEHDTSENEDD